MANNEYDPHMAEARRILTAGLREARKLTPRAQAESAHFAGGPSVDELELMVIDYRIRIGQLPPRPDEQAPRT
jgi:hypothetical protein